MARELCGQHGAFIRKDLLKLIIGLRVFRHHALAEIPDHLIAGFLLGDFTKPHFRHAAAGSIDNESIIFFRELAAILLGINVSFSIRSHR